MKKDSSIDPALVYIWLKGWTQARDTAPPVKYGSGFEVNVGWPQQQKRYVFPALTDDLVQLAHSISEPWIHLKVLAKPEQVGSILPSGWQIQPVGYMMTCFAPMQTGPVALPEKYKLAIVNNPTVQIARIETQAGHLAAIGRVTLADGFAIYDRIETQPEHKRQGLATVLMKTLEETAKDLGAEKGLLVATGNGRALYETMGWSLYSEYTTAFIPGT